ncbi:MAG: hypothetical protein JNM52_10720 [Betaproteobacteria bacterium]|nr:hypothetical protein [Betaproteobacteria bacterium]
MRSSFSPIAWIINAFKFLKCELATICQTMRAAIPAVGLSFITLTNPAHGQDAAKNTQNDWDTAWSLLTKQDRPLSAIALMEKMVETKQLPAQTLAQFYAFTGDERGTNALMDTGIEINPLPPVKTSGYTQKPAIDAIAEAARGRRIVILNESHDSQRQRAFALDVVMRLYKLGFSHLGAETFSQVVAESMKDGAPDLKTGVYTLDPLLADLTRQAAQTGYQLFNYEQRPDQRPAGKVDRIARITAREQAQADNIKKWLDANPDAKLIIYVGGQHASEIPDQDNVAWMALRLKQMTGLDPLTIDQTAGTPRGRAELDSPLYQAAFHTNPISYPIVLVNKAGEWLSREGYDIVVFHPRLPDSAGRPGWLSMNGYRKSHSLKLPPLPTRTLIRAFVKGEPDGSIAMDQILVKENQTAATLMLPIGQYIVMRELETGELIPIDAALTIR